MGKRVGVFPLIPCRECVSCRKGHYEMCSHYGYLGSRQDGGLAEYVRVPVSNLIELPENVAFELAAMLEPMAVAVHAMRRVNSAHEDAEVVWGLGTIGMLLVMFLLERGIRNLYVIGNKDFQREKALEVGVLPENFCDSRTEEVRAWVQNRTQGNGADVVFECIGKKDTIAQSIDLAAAGGSVCMVGNPQSDVVLPRDAYWKILRRQLRITGTWNSSFDISGGTDELSAEKNTDWKYVLQLLTDQRIRPEQLISHRLKLEELTRGLLIMRDKSEDYLKVMIEV